MAVSTVMMNWMMVFQVFRSLRNFIKSSLVFVLVYFEHELPRIKHEYFESFMDIFRSFVLKREERERGEQAAFMTFRTLRFKL